MFIVKIFIFKCLNMFDSATDSMTKGRKCPFCDASLKIVDYVD